MSKSEPLIDRLNYSSIVYVDPCEDEEYFPDELDASIRILIDQFSRAVRNNNGNSPLNLSKPELVNIVIMLLSCHSNIIKEYKAQQLNPLTYKPVEDHHNSETDYRVKYVVPFINSVFHVNGRLQIYWDVPFDFYSSSNMSIQHRQTSDAKFVELDGLEIGAVEIKPFNTSAVLIMILYGWQKLAKECCIKG